MNSLNDLEDTGSKQGNLDAQIPLMSNLPTQKKNETYKLSFAENPSPPHAKYMAVTEYPCSSGLSSVPANSTRGMGSIVPNQFKRREEDVNSTITMQHV